MSVLESFFKVAATIAIITLGMNIALGIFAEPMAGGLLPVPTDVNASVTRSDESETRQSSTSPEDIPTGLLENAINDVKDWIVNSISSTMIINGSPLTNTIYAILAPMGTTYANMAISIGIIILMFQAVGGAYIIISAVSIVRGGGTSP